MAVLLVAAPVATAAAESLITVEGNRRVEADTIRSYVRAGPGGHFDAAGVDAALKALYASGLFADVRISQAGDRLVVTVVENPVINRVAFEGNKKVKDDQLKGEVQSKDRGTLSRPTLQSDVVRIVDVYRRSGYFNVRVEPKTIELPNKRVDVVFEITEGEKSGVKDIVFAGNNAFSSLRLKQVIKSGVSNPLSFLLNNDLYDPDRVEADRDLLRRFYLKHGYADIRVVSALASFDPAQKGFIVTFTIDEGSRYRLGPVDIQSNVPAVDTALLRSKLTMAAGDVYNAEAVDKTVERLTIELAKHGYPFAVVRPRADRDGKARTINLTYGIEEGARAYVERINIRGNTKTRDHVIRREFEIAEGDAYNRAMVDRAERRLKNLGYFKTVKISNELGSGPDRVILHVDVEEQATGDFSVAGGYSTVDGFIAEVSVSERNFLGRGQYVKAAVTYGQYTRGFNVGFAEPYFLGSRISAGVDLFAKETTSNTYQSYGSTTYGGTLSMGTPLTEQVGVVWRYSLYRQETTLAPALMDCSPGNPPPGCYANGEASVPIKQAALNGPTWVSAVGYTLTYSTLDNNKNPTSGFRSELRQDLAGVGGDAKFLKTTDDLRYYHEIAKDVVGLARVQSGYVTPWGGQQLALANGFFGGPQFVRGFAPNGFGPRDTTAGTTMDNVGGSKYWATTAELRAPVPWLPPEFGLKVATFADAGSLWGYKGPASFPSLSQSLQVSDSRTIRSSIGAGLIWDSPLGPLRVDYAYPTSKATYDVTQRFRFSAGAF